MYSSICDATGNVRGSFGYMGAAYDRWAAMHSVRRIRTSCRYEHGVYSQILNESCGGRYIQGTVEDSNGRILFATEWLDDSRESATKETDFHTIGDVQQRKLTAAWIAKHFPQANDHMAYWDTELTFIEPSPAPKPDAAELVKFREREEQATRAAEALKRREEARSFQDRFGDDGYGGPRFIGPDGLPLRFGDDWQGRLLRDSKKPRKNGSR
jgi:hypothetical protein